jgi:hypothetical protein
VPLGFAAVALVLDERSRLGWPQRIPADDWSVMIAVVLVAVGLGLATLYGARMVPGDSA